MKQHISLPFVMALALTVFSCQNEDFWIDVQSDRGHIFLTMPAAQPFQTGATRAEETLTDLSGYTFTLKGKDNKGNSISKEITFNDVDNSCIIPAGEYTLTADNHAVAVFGHGAAYYNGTSESFTLSPGGRTQVPTIQLGTPQNTRIVLRLDKTFTDLYELQSLSLSDGGTRTISLDANNLQGFMMVPENNTLTYTIKATAKQGSHVSDLPAEGLKKNLTVTPGYAYSILLTAKTIEDIMIEIGNGSHEGEFDAPAEKFPWNLKKLK